MRWTDAPAALFIGSWTAMVRKYSRIGIAFRPDELNDIDALCDRLSKLNERSKRNPFSRCEAVRYIVDDFFKRQREKAREER